MDVMKASLVDRAPWMALGLALIVSSLVWIRQVRSGEQGTHARFEEDTRRVERLLKDTHIEPSRNHGSLYANMTEKFIEEGKRRWTK